MPTIPSKFKDLRGKYIAYRHGGRTITVQVLKAEWAELMWKNTLTDEEAFIVKFKVKDSEGSVFYTKPFPSGVYKKKPLGIIPEASQPNQSLTGQI